MCIKRFPDAPLPVLSCILSLHFAFFAVQIHCETQSYLLFLLWLHYGMIAKSIIAQMNTENFLFLLLEG